LVEFTALQARRQIPAVRIRVYILHSASLDRYYTGFTGRHEVRLREHQRGLNVSTQIANDWVEVWCRELESTSEARAMEKKIKARGAKRFLGEQ
jgi:putative endonuclease